MRIGKRMKENAAIVDVAGELDLHSSQELRSVMLDAIRQQVAPRLILNLKGVSYIDSSGVSVLVEGLKASGGGKGKFALCGLGPEVRDVLKLTQLLPVFEVYENEDDCLRAGS